jgi:galactokinase
LNAYKPPLYQCKVREIMENQKLIEAYQHRRGNQIPSIARAPGRVNLIGDHTDYNDGFVMPMAIDREIKIAFTPRTDGKLCLFSIDFQEEFSMDLSSFEKGESHWGEYIKGIAWALQERGYSLKGWQGVMSGNIPKGAGLSSSAALELVAAVVFSRVSRFPWAPKEMALLAQKAENQWVGVNCGIMDQLISAAGEKDHALFMDCRNLETQSVPMPKGTAVIVMDTGTRRGLVDSAYNERREQCERASFFFNVPALRDVSMQTFQDSCESMDELIKKRARHVIGENQRVILAVEAMKKNQASELGKFLYESHVSLRDDFEVSSEALNLLVEIAMKDDACYGARMTGAGFGGCAVAVVKDHEAQAFMDRISSAFRIKASHSGEFYLCQAMDGAGVIEQC